MTRGRRRHLIYLVMKGASIQDLVRKENMHLGKFMHMLLSPSAEVERALLLRMEQLERQLRGDLAPLPAPPPLSALPEIPAAPLSVKVTVNPPSSQRPCLPPPLGDDPSEEAADREAQRLDALRQKEFES